MNKAFSILVVVALLSCGSVAGASDGFGAVRCGSDIGKALIGRAMSNEPVVAIEGRHKDLQLADLGGSEVTEQLFLASWRICADEYALLEAKDVVKDVLKFPAHSKDAPEFVGTCQFNGKPMHDTLIAVLEDRPGADLLPVKSAWKIDEARSRFVELPAQGLLCPRDGVITTDGGP